MLIVTPAFKQCSSTLTAHWKAIKRHYLQISKRLTRACLKPVVISPLSYEPIRLPLVFFHTCCKQMQFPWRHGEPLSGFHGYYSSEQAFWLVESHIELGCCTRGWRQTRGGRRVGREVNKLSLISVSITWLSAEPDTRFSTSISHTDTLTDSYVVSPT